MNYLSSKQFDNMKISIYDMKFHNVSLEVRQNTIATIASICYDKTHINNNDYKQRIYDTLLANGHYTPFEFVRGNPPILENSLRHKYDLGYHITPNYYIFHLEIPMFIKNQIIRHRSFSFMEVSRRYTKPGMEDFYIKDPLTKEMVEESLEQYNKAIESGIKPEIARLVLPAYALKCKFWMAGTVDQYKDFIIKRLCDKSQEETKEVVKAMGDLLRIYGIK